MQPRNPATQPPAKTQGSPNVKLKPENETKLPPKPPGPPAPEIVTDSTGKKPLDPFADMTRRSRKRAAKESNR